MTDEKLIAELKRLDDMGAEGLQAMRALLKAEGGMSRIIELAERGLARLVRQKAEVRKTHIPEGYPDAEAKAAAVAYWSDKRRPDLVDRIDEIAEQFHDRNEARNERYSRWDLAWRTWYVRAVSFERPPQGAGLFPVASVAFEQQTPQGWVSRLELYYGLTDQPRGTWSPKWRQKPDETPNCIPPEAWRLFEAKHPGVRRSA